ncbi:MAG TPA: UvrD-helicase domain-containing protein, partial [Actinomycetes bacterium]|nr:UvrD-helicase domain-containing protein [Actinomycetes bacterium]
MTIRPGGDAATHDPRHDAPPTELPDAPPAAIAAGLPDGNLVVLGGPGSGKTALLEAAMHDILARPGGTALFVTSSRQAAVASSERLLARLQGAAGGSLACVTWHAFARGLVTSHADLLPYRGEPRPLSGPEQWSLVRELLLHDPPVVRWGELEPLVGTRAFTDELAELVLA